ncbi:MAG: gamma-glutamyltransferase family protein [Peptoniphilus sp.]|nr:gamma-glutamyltransferase family protein [Peptoniphilus sp.]MDD7363786.1 gamma-glutamyltransferase family protein [Bacillota bacterium]MDY6044627.1 gamma-glutamyltransferase family protein [Peptoniphilus sp.]
MYHNYPYPSKRTVVYGRAAALASNPSAATAGEEILRRGGNAVDAAVAIAAAQTVVEPTSNGLGSDLFAILSIDGKLYGYNGSGKSPKALRIEEIRKKGYDCLPPHAPESVGVPGAVKAWVDIHRAHGRLPFKDVLAPAMRYAKEGYILSPTVARLWQKEFEKRKDATGPLYDAFWKQFSRDGEAPKPGDVITQPDLYRTLAKIADDEGEDFYRGETAGRIATFLREHGGYMDISDLAEHETLAVDPLSISFDGCEVWELPPNGQGISVLMALKILRDKLLLPDDGVSAHLTAEAIKRAMTDAARYVADPAYMSLTPEDLLSDAYLKKCADDIGEEAESMTYGNPLDRSTVYFCTGDDDGNMVSMIQSNYDGFGSGIVVPGTGISLNNRLLNFSLEDGHDNCLAGGKRPYHTIIPGFLTKGGRPYGAFGVMGGFMQPQGHVQTLLQLLRYGRNPQSALDAPRFMWTGEKTLVVEDDYDEGAVEELLRRGHVVVRAEDNLDMGRGQYLLYDEKTGVYCAGTEKRTDGYIATIG